MVIFQDQYLHCSISDSEADKGVKSYAENLQNQHEKSIWGHSHTLWRLPVKPCTAKTDISAGSADGSADSHCAAHSRAQHTTGT